MCTGSLPTLWVPIGTMVSTIITVILILSKINLLKKGHLMNDRADGLLGGFVVVKPEDPMEWELDGKRVTVGRQYYSILQVR